MEGRLEARMFGTLTIRRPDGTVVDHWVRPTGRRLLCLILLSPGRSLTRAQVARTLFPEADANAPNALAKAIHWCRQALGAPWHEHLVSDGGWLRWEGGAWIDADAVLQAARAGVPADDLATLRTIADQPLELLPGWDDEWVDQFREEVRRGRRVARTGLARALSDGGPAEVAEALCWWQALVDEDPLDQDMQIALLRALFAAGREDEARAAWRRCRQVLWAEVGVVPGPELEEVWRTRGVPASPQRPPTRPVPTRSRTTPDRTPLVGRTHERAELIELLGGADVQRGGSVTLLGPAGAGKSSLLRAVTAHVRAQGWQVAEAAGTARLGHPYGTAHVLLEALLPDGDRTALDRLLGAGPGPLTPPTHQVRGDATLHASVGQLLERAVTIPTLLAVDDLHDVDPASLRLLQALARTGRPRSWSIVAASRYATSTLGTGELVTVAPLDDDSIRTVILNRYPASPAHQVETAVARSGGNPLFALEIAALLRVRGDTRAVPPTAIELLRERLRRLQPAERLLLPLVTIAGDEATWEVLTEASRRLWTDPAEDATVRHAVDVLRADDLLRENGSAFTPSHPLIGEAALTLLGRTTKAALHDAISEALSLLRPASAALFHHRMAAFESRPDAQHASSAVDAALHAARLALSQGRDHDAADMARRADRAWTSADAETRRRLTESRSEALLILGHALACRSPQESGAAYRLGWSNAPDDETRARFLVAEGWMRYMHGDLAQAAQTYQSGLTLSGVRAATKASVCTHLGWVLARQGLFDDGLRLCDDALALLAADPDPLVHGTALDRRGMILAFMGHTQEARSVVDQAFVVATVAADPALLCAIQAHRGSIRGRLGEWEAALRCLDEAVALARSVGDPYLESIAWWSRTDVLTRKGDLVSALAANLEEDRCLQLTGNELHHAACRRRRRRLTGEEELEPAQAAGPTP